METPKPTYYTCSPHLPKHKTLNKFLLKNTETLSFYLLQREIIFFFNWNNVKKIFKREQDERYEPIDER
jgi:hypothetical protein